MSLRWALMFLLLVLIVLFAAAPIISVAIAGYIAQSHGCVLHEGFVNPCVVGGEDMGETLYTMFVMGWFMLATLPIGLIALAVWAGVAIFLLLAGRRRTPPPSQTPAAGA